MRVAYQIWPGFSHALPPIAEAASALHADVPLLTDEQKLMLFHIAQEALANVRKHAGPAP